MKRWTLRIVLLLVLGCVTTVAVAWGFVVLASGHGAHPRGERTVDARHEGLWRARRPEFIDATLPNTALRYHADIGYSQVALMSALNDLQMCWIDRAGWPAHALSSELWWSDSRGEVLSRSMIETHFADSSTMGLPLRPIWPGFVVNTLFYGLIWFGIFFGFGSARRAVRRRRGRCPKCAYDIRSEFDAGCSECGWNRANVQTSKSENEG